MNEEREPTRSPGAGAAIGAGSSPGGASSANGDGPARARRCQSSNPRLDGRPVHAVKLALAVHGKGFQDEAGAHPIRDTGLQDGGGAERADQRRSRGSRGSGPRCAPAGTEVPCRARLIALAHLRVDLRQRVLAEALRHAPGQGAVQPGRYVLERRSPQESAAGAAGPRCAARGRRGPRRARAGRVRAASPRARAWRAARPTSAPSDLHDAQHRAHVTPTPLHSRVATVSLRADAEHRGQRTWSKSCRRSSRSRCRSATCGPGKPLLGGLLRFDFARGVARIATLAALDLAGLFLAIYTALVVKAALRDPGQHRPDVGPGEGLPAARRPRDAAAVRALRPLPRPRAAARPSARDRVALPDDRRRADLRDPRGRGLPVVLHLLRVAVLRAPLRVGVPLGVRAGERGDPARGRLPPPRGARRARARTSRPSPTRCATAARSSPTASWRARRWRCSTACATSARSSSSSATSTRSTRC